MCRFVSSAEKQLLSSRAKLVGLTKPSAWYVISLRAHGDNYILKRAGKIYQKTNPVVVLVVVIIEVSGKANGATREVGAAVPVTR